jgi:methylaspartate ammonia-lyase
MALSPVQMLAKPGMGMDEGYLVAYNEMRRILALKNVVGKTKKKSKSENQEA